MLSQVADFLYAPTDCILIERFLGAEFVAYYSPALQIDAALLLLVSGIAVVLYPKSAIAHAAGDVQRLKRYYVRGTLISFAMLLVASLTIWLSSGWIFTLWFGVDMPQTRAILPLLLVHTVIGGSSAVGRSVLLAVGKAKQFTVAVLLAGVTNVLLSWLLVRSTNLGLKGIVLGTIIVVVVRCALWMPWYVWRTLKKL
jgi:O-antigen/teichoic acid export membrane protein